MLQIRVVAFDDIYPKQTSTATVEVNMIRNLNRPEWKMETPVEVTIKETDSIGSVVTDVIRAEDPDGVRLMELYFSMVKQNAL